VQILLALIVGAAIGTAAHFLSSGRATRGTALGPVLGAVVAGAAWMILTWSGLGLDSVWLWLSAFLVPAVVVYPVLSLLARSRTTHDARERARLKIG